MNDASGTYTFNDQYLNRAPFYTHSSAINTFLTRSNSDNWVFIVDKENYALTEVSDCPADESTSSFSVQFACLPSKLVFVFFFALFFVLFLNSVII